MFFVLSVIVLSTLQQLQCCCLFPLLIEGQAYTGAYKNMGPTQVGYFRDTGL